MSKVHEIARRLSEAKIHFELASYRDDAVMLIASVPGKRLEIEIFSDNSVEVEVFSSRGDITDEASLDRIIKHYSE